VKNRNLLLILLVLVVSIVIYLVFFRNKGFDESEIEPQLTDTSEISSFVVTQNDCKVEVSRKTGQWMVNGNYHANVILVKRLLRLFKNLDIKILIPEDEADAQIAELQNRGIKLSFFADGDELETYWIGEFNDKQKATLVLNPERVPAYVTAPGLSEDLKQFVECDPIFWRDKRIFDIEPKNIRKIEYQDFVYKESSFTAVVDNSDYQLLDYKGANTDFISENVARYLSYFKNIRFDSLANHLSTKQEGEVLKQQPLAIITVTDIYGETSSLKLLQKSLNNDPNQPDLNLVYGLLNNEKPLVIISYYSIDPLLKSINYFKEK